jgi:transcriptional/translational regulatory protein YebC/TACO1
LSGRSARSGSSSTREASLPKLNTTPSMSGNRRLRSASNFGESGSVAWQFNTRGVVTLTLSKDTDPEEVALLAIDAGAEDFEVDEDSLSIYTKVEDLMAVHKALAELGHEPDSAEIDRVPTVTVPLEEKEAVQTLRLLEKLEDLDDVQKVYSNADFPEEVLASFSE